jgi:glycine betaine/proline transport system substrate-binding protein
MGSRRLVVASLAGSLGMLAGHAQAAEPASCRQVRMADPGWTDITATNAFAGVVLNALGYEQKVASLSVPITYVGVKKEQIDVFLGNWMPAQKALVEPLVKEGSLEVVRANLPGAKFTLAVPTWPGSPTGLTRRSTASNPVLPPTRTSRK